MREPRSRASFHIPSTPPGPVSFLAIYSRECRPEPSIVGLDRTAYDWASPVEGQRSAIVALTRGDRKVNRRTVTDLSAKGIDVALRGGRIRVSPHLYNTLAEINALVGALHEASTRH